MTIDNKITDEKLQYGINKVAAKISALSSGKIDRYEYLTGEEILPCNQRQILEQAKFEYPPLGKVFEKQTKTIEDEGEKQVKTLENNVEKKMFRHRSKTFFVFKAFSKWRSYIWIKQNCRNGK